MNAKSFVQQLKETILAEMQNGLSEVRCENLLAYLEYFEKNDGLLSEELEIEQLKAQWQFQIESQKNNHSADLEMFRSVIAAGQNAIRTAFLLNGGACVAMLAFVGHIAQFKASEVPSVAASLIPFAIGVFLAALTSGLTYLSQWLYASENIKVQKVGFGVNIATILIGLSSFGGFVWGIIKSYSVLVSFGS